MPCPRRHGGAPPTPAGEAGDGVQQDAGEAVLWRRRQRAARRWGGGGGSVRRGGGSVPRHVGAPERVVAAALIWGRGENVGSRGWLGVRGVT
jgi:hypothetical protein